MKRSASLLTAVVLLAGCGSGASDTAQTAHAITTNGLEATLVIRNDWGTGYCADVILANKGTATVTSWTVVINLNQSTLAQLWSGTYTVSGSQVTVSPVSWNATVAPGATSTPFGFCGNSSSSTYRPALFSLTVVGGNGPSDGGVIDGGTDGGTDGGIDGGTDGGIDGGTDGGIDGGTDGGTDGGVPDGGASYMLNPPDPCYSQYYVSGCVDGVATSTCGGKCKVANACSPPEDPSKSNLPMTFACPRDMLYSDEMKQAVRDDTAANGWGDANNPPFNYGVVGHDADNGGLDGSGWSTCCQCYQLVFERPEPGSPQPPDLPIPKPMVVQSFNTSAGGGKNFDIFMGAGGFGAFNACVSGTYSGSQTTNFGHFMYGAFPYQYNGNGGIKFININECKVNGTTTVASLTSATCQNKIGQLCDNTAAPLAVVTNETKSSCKQTNLLASAYHQNWTVRAKKVECPTALTRVTGCRLAAQGLPQPDPRAQTPATADSTFRTGYTTTTMQDCCKPSCAWQDQTVGAGLTVSGKWSSFYSCDQNGVPITTATP